MKKKTLAGLVLISSVWSSTSVAGLVTSAYFEQSTASSGDTPCITGGSASSSCNIKNYYEDANGRYSILSSNAEALASGTTLKSRTSIAFDGHHDEASVSAEIIANEVPDVEDETAYFQFMYDNSDYFDEDGNFDPNAFLGSNTIDMPNSVTSYASASFNDVWTITGGDVGTAGTVSIFYQLDGTINNAILSDESSSVEGAANGTAMLRFIERQTTQHPDGYTIISTAQEDRFDLTSSGSFDSLIELQLNFIFGQEFSMALYLNSVTYADFSHYSGNTPDFDISSDFFNTAIFDSMKIKDANGQLIDDYGLLSDAGNAAFARTASNSGNNNGSTDVPEPSTLMLFALGALGLLCRRYKK